MRVGIAFDLKSDFEEVDGRPDDALEEYDSEATVDAIATALAAAGHEPSRLGGGRRFVERLLAAPPDLVFNIAEGHGTRSREAHVPAVCEMLGVPVTHSDPLTAALTLDKEMAKRVAASAGVPTPRFAVVRSPRELDALDLRYPLIAKPCSEGSSIGIRRSSRSATPLELRKDVERLCAGYGQPVLVEEFCPGAEMTVGIVGSGARAEALGALANVPRHVPVDQFVYSLEVKREWESELDYVFPAPQPAEVVRAVTDVALAAYRALGCRDVGRVDVRLAGDGSPMFLELNPLPGLNPRTGDIAILARLCGVGYDGLIARIVAEAWGRYAPAGR